MMETITGIDIFTAGCFIAAVIKCIIPNHKSLKESLKRLENGEHVR